MKKKRRSNREFFEQHREQFERSERVFKDWLERFEERESAKRAARRSATESSETA